MHEVQPQERHSAFLPQHKDGFAAKQHLPCKPRAAEGLQLVTAGKALGWAGAERPQPEEASITSIISQSRLTSAEQKQPRALQATHQELLVEVSNRPHCQQGPA